MGLEFEDDRDLAEYALTDFNGHKIWIYRESGISTLLVPTDDNNPRTGFNHKMLKFEFFTSGRLGKDSTSRIIGLIGELLVLENVVKQLGAGAISSWWGPERHRHDFEFENSGIEVKTTINTNSNEVEIHGLKQLSPDPERSLYLAHLKINLDPKGSNLNELVKRILDSKVSKFELDEKIKKSGVTDDLIESFSNFKFNGFIARYFLVDGAFPSITQENLSAGDLSRISRVSYKIDLNDLVYSHDFPSVNL